MFSKLTLEQTRAAAKGKWLFIDFTVLFLGNNAAGSDALVAALGRHRVLIGSVNAGE